MKKDNIKLEPWVCVLKDEKRRTVEVVRFDNLQELLDWRRTEEGLSIDKMEGLRVVSMTERYYIGLYTQEHEMWWNKVEHLIRKL